jgi:Spx/MgsR family transcriptional regulator
MTIEVYGLDKCSTCDKARKWLAKRSVAHRFIDYREQRVPAPTLREWAKAVGGFDKLVNRTGMTWRNLPPARKEPGSDAEWTLLIKEYPALVRRPVVVLADGSISLGFTDKLFARLFADPAASAASQA